MVFPLSIKWARVSDGHGWTANVLVVCLVFLADLCVVVISWKTTNVTIEALGLVSVEWQWYCEVSHRSHTGLTQVSHRDWVYSRRGSAIFIDPMGKFIQY